MLIIGFSTGALAFGDFAEGLELLYPTHANAVELSALRSAELSVLIAQLPSRIDGLRERFEYISFHAPTDFTNEQETVQKLAAVAEIGLNIVVHPDTICDPLLWRQLGKSVCIENMDTRKGSGRTAKELRRFFSALPEAGLCLDIAHARQVDPTMLETYRILTEFGDRLAQVHISEVDGAGKHFPMSFGARLAFSKFADVLAKVPLIIESIVSRQEIEPEIESSHETFARTGVTYMDRYTNDWEFGFGH